jgi:hypothetical protein
MSNALVDVTVRQDWQAIALEITGQRRRLWRVAEVALLSVTILVVTAAKLWPGWPWLGALEALLFTAVFWLLPLTYIFRSVGLSLAAIILRLLAASLLLLTGAAIVYATIPDNGAPSFWPGALPVLLVPIITWSLLFTIRERYPIPVRLLGMTFEHWPINVAIGAAAGLVLGLHLLLISGWLLALEPQSLPDPALLLWALAFRLGLSALGEELFLRGLGYSVIQGGQGTSLLATLVRIALLNLLIYLLPLLNSQPSPVASALLLAYGAAFAVTATLLRYIQRSLLPSLACNVVFSLFLIVLLLP